MWHVKFYNAAWQTGTTQQILPIFSIINIIIITNGSSTISF